MEKKLIPFNYKRVYDCPKGALRVFIFIFYLLILLPIYASIGDYNVGLHYLRYGGSHSSYLFLIPAEKFYFTANAPNELIILAISSFLTGTFLLYYSYWTLIRISLWIIDGFKENK